MPDNYSSNLALPAANKCLERLKTRPGHFLAPALPANPLGIFEPPADAWTFGSEKSPGGIVAELARMPGGVGAG